MTLWTIGHSTKSIDEFLALLTSHDITRLVDVRTIPRSRHNPQFNTDRLAKRLKKEGLGYLHMPQLGGLRKAKKDSINVGWRNASFRGYADYMQSEQFWQALEDLMRGSIKKNTAIMCAEAVPWRCHRSMIADALVTKGWTVRHILSKKHSNPHSLTSFAVLQGDRIIYPSADHAALRLF